jgi:hypothetical protein
MRKNFTVSEKSNGELAVRRCSEKAQAFFNSGCGIEVYAVRMPAEDVRIFGDEKGDEFVTRYFSRGDYADQDCMTLEELDRMLCDLAEM